MHAARRSTAQTLAAGLRVVKAVTIKNAPAFTASLRERHLLVTRPA